MNIQNKPALTWLGQSGFLLDCGGVRIACDLYLSDFCVKRSKLDHTRLTPIPCAPESLDDIDHYLITHPHIDHFDPETIGPVLHANARTKFYCPPSASAMIAEFFPQDEKRFTKLACKKEVQLTESIRLVAVPAAHEELEKDSSGEFISFSYVILLDQVKKAIFFAGDTIPYENQSQHILDAIPNVYELTMVLPVNGRDAERAKTGFKGNLNIAEAVALSKQCNAKLLVPCHFGMFALNDIREELSPEVFKKAECTASIPVVNKQIALA